MTAKERNILQALQSYDIPDQVKEHANLIFKKINKLARMSRRDLLIFKCVYDAYSDLGMYQDPFALGATMKLTHKQVNKSFTMYNSFQTDYNTETKEISTEDILICYCRGYGFEEDRIENCVELYEKLIEKDSTLEEINPKKLSGAILKYYMMISGLNIDKKEFSKIIGLSDATISCIYKRIYDLDNSIIEKELPK